MTSTVEFDAFLADLTVRREQLLDQAGDGPEHIGLREAARQMRLADEELRVQHEELLEANQRLRASLSENESYFRSSSHARVVTDPDGVVLLTNPAADQLIRRRPGHTVRPIVTWFQIADRGRLRGMIGRMQRSLRARQDGSAADQAVLRLPGGSLLTVFVAVTTAVDTRSGDPVLRWELRTALDGILEPRPHSVTDEPGLDGEPRPVPAPDRPGPLSIALAESLAVMAGQLASCTDLPDLLKSILEGAITNVPGAQRAAVTLRQKGLKVAAAASDDTALACERAQLTHDAGPTVRALHGDITVAATIPDQAAQWPWLATVASRSDVRRVLAVPLSYGEEPLGVLSMYSGHPDSFGAAVRTIAPLVATHAAVGLHRMEREENLQFAMRTRQNIGEAVGILVERHRILPDQAFQRLVKSSQQHNVKVRDIAETVVGTGQDPEDIQLR